MKGSELLGETTARLMDKLDEGFSGQEDAEILEVIVITRVGTRPGQRENNLGWSQLNWQASDPVWTHQLGLLEGVIDFEKSVRLAGFLQTTREEDE